LGQSRFFAAPDDDTNASFRTKSQSFLHGGRNCSEWPDKLLRVASITASARLEELVPASYKREEAEAAGEGETDKLRQVGRPLTVSIPQYHGFFETMRIDDNIYIGKLSTKGGWRFLLSRVTAISWRHIGLIG
jgi:hypothetical protein